MRIIARLIAFALPAAFGLALGLFAATSDWAQSLPPTPSGPGFYYQYEPGPDGFNKAFQAKQDWPMQSFLVAALPPCNSALFAYWYIATDATSPTYNGALTGGGSVKVPVFCNGAAWTSH